MTEEKVYLKKSEKLVFTKTNNLTNFNYKLVLITGGEACLELSGKKYNFTRGTFALVMPYEYAVVTAKSATALFLEVAFNDLSSACKKLLYTLTNRVVKMPEDDIPRINDIFSAISYEINSNLKHSDDLVNNLVYCLIAEFARRTVIKGEKGDTHIAKSLTFINDNYLSDITLNDIATSAGVTVNYFCALFKNKMGINSNRYIKQLKICYAEKLLILEGLKAQDTAKKCGYASFSHFMSDFKTVTGKTPNSLKKEYLGD